MKSGTEGLHGANVEGLHGANVVLNRCSVGTPTQQFRQGCRASRSTASTVHAAELGAQVRVSNEPSVLPPSPDTQAYLTQSGQKAAGAIARQQESRSSGRAPRGEPEVRMLGPPDSLPRELVPQWQDPKTEFRWACRACSDRGLARSGSFRDARTRGCGPWMGAGIAVTGSTAVDRVPGIVDRVAVTTARARGAEACRGVGVATTRAGGIGPMWVSATRRRAEADFTNAAEAAATTAADLAGSGVDAELVPEARKAAGGVRNRGDENTPPGAGEASEAAPSVPKPPSSSISICTEASVPGLIPLETTGVLGSEAIDAVDDAGDAGVRGIGENGGVDPLGIDANDNTSPSVETAMPEAGADEVETEAAGSDEGTVCPLLLPGADQGLLDDFAGLLSLPLWSAEGMIGPASSEVSESTVRDVEDPDVTAAPPSDPEEAGGVGTEPTEDPEADGGGGIGNCSAPNSTRKVAKAAGIADADAELAPPETEL
ncbi:unnamed protein product [Phytophthora fragariaefolia]|uniref:Unnamed protein product n=1 Tax=Phytophthora fragariaefolia TaxID=1490495 RepID=A0A9W7CXG8_9STRA|nr:unnamed protein product [Phytophthora fragariaefolia]